MRTHRRSSSGGRGAIALAIALAAAVILPGTAFAGPGDGQPVVTSIPMTLKTARVFTRGDAVCDDTNVPCSSSADCSGGKACLGKDADSWSASGTIDPAGDTEAFLREIDRDGVECTVGFVAAAQGATIFFEGGECAPAGGENALAAERGVRCRLAKTGSTLLLKPRRRADGSSFVRIGLQVKKQALERPGPTSADTPVEVSLIATTFTAVDGVDTCKDRNRGGVSCRDR